MRRVSSYTAVRIAGSKATHSASAFHVKEDCTGTSLRRGIEAGRTSLMPYKNKNVHHELSNHRVYAFATAILIVRPV